MIRKRVIVEYAERWASGGIESYILNIAKRINREKYEIRIVVAQKETDIYDKELASLGCRVESILEQIQENPIKRMIKNKNAFKKYFIDNPCDVLHLHICQGVAMNYCKTAKRIGVAKVITHCHNTELGEGNRLIKKIGHNLGKRMYEKYADKLVACSGLAADWLYTSRAIKKNKVEILKYLVDVDKFVFSVESRNELRARYNISNEKCVYLNIGRLSYQKNQKFLLDIYYEILKKRPESILVLIGTGELKNEIYSYAKDIEIYSKIIFVDTTREIHKYMSMADIFLLPSLFEGNPIVGIEAQASGLTCVFSDSITREAKILDTSFFISLSKEAKEWAEIINQCSLEKERSRCNLEVIANGYNVNSQITCLEKLYS